MFTGIIGETGLVEAVARSGGITRFDIGATVTLDDLSVGGSVAVNGACLTAVSVGAGILTVEAIQETLRRTNLGGLQIGARVNLERPLAVGARLEGHWVQGHVDGVARVRGRRAEGVASERFEVELPSGLARYVVEKGSIAIDGISLTVGEVSADAFAVYLIPHTLEITTLGARRVGDRLNLEVDILAKYVERLQSAGAAEKAGLATWLAEGESG